MKLRTEISLPVSEFNFNHDSRIITLGSCFSEVIGAYLLKHKFVVKSNPFGTVFNLKSLHDVIANAGVAVREDRIVERDGLFFHLDYHSAFSARSVPDLVESIQAAGERFRAFLLTAEHVIVTLGTSWVYVYKNEPVSNCHKLPAARFDKRLLDLEEQKVLLDQLIGEVRQVNPAAKLMLTVSPVRHIKDGIPENSLSKAMLRVVCGEAVRRNDHVSYFPSFEIMMDDLRDYRFYKADLIHPDEVAEQYICELFMQHAVTEEARKLSAGWSKVLHAMEHRPFNPGSESYRTFLRELIGKVKAFEPHFDISQEYEELEKRLREF